MRRSILASEQPMFEVFHQYIHRRHHSERQHRGYHQAAKYHGAQLLLAVSSVASVMLRADVLGG